VFGAVVVLEPVEDVVPVLFDELDVEVPPVDRLP
jgi:hypothetical protein